MSRSLLVSRTSLSLSPLQLWSPPKYTVVGDTFGPGAQVLRRETVTGPYTDGRFLIGYVRDTQVAPLHLEVQGTSGSDLSTNVAEVLAALSQSSYTVTFNWDGVTGAWLCEPADYAVGESGLLQDIDLVYHATSVLFSIPRSPVPSSGTF